MLRFLDFIHQPIYITIHLASYYMCTIVICQRSYDLPTLYKRLYLVEPLWKFRLQLDGSKCHLPHHVIIHTPEALPPGMIQPITAAMLERFQNLNKSWQPNHSYKSM